MEFSSGCEYDHDLMNVVITGASGLLGRALVARLAEAGHRVVPLRRTDATDAAAAATWDPASGRVRFGPGLLPDAVVHLAGETIAQRWTPESKARIRASRVDGTRALCEALAALPQPPRTLVCASATGFYGDRGNEVLDEASAPGSGFLPEVCQAWEAASAPARQAGVRVVHLRLGIVLARGGGALEKMLPAFRLGLGGRLGNGRQYWSWIALEDVLRITELALTDAALDGAINVVAPEAVTNRQFTAALARALHRPAFLPAPAFLLRAALGEMADATLFASTRVRPARLLEKGFAFRFPELAPTLRHLLA